MPPGRPGAPGRPGSSLAAPDPAQDRRHQNDQLAEEAQALEEELEALKARYEQYFLGVERREPVKWREDVKKKILRLKGAFTRNAGLRFKIQSLHARYLSYERLWLRHAREKEEGTYRRDVVKARRRPGEEAPAAATAAGTAGATAPAPAAAASQPPVATSAAKTALGGPGPKPGAAAAARPAGSGSSGGEAQLRALYDAYVAAKKSCNEDVSRLTYEAVARTVSKQVPELMAKYKARSVDFKVEVKNGKAVLKAIPKV
jgi:hypothetical protein